MGRLSFISLKNIVSDFISSFSVPYFNFSQKFIKKARKCKGQTIIYARRNVEVEGAFRSYHGQSVIPQVFSAESRQGAYRVRDRKGTSGQVCCPSIDTEGDNHHTVQTALHIKNSSGQVPVALSLRCC